MEQEEIKKGLRIKGTDRANLSSRFLTTGTIIDIDNGIFTVKFDDGGCNSWYCNSGYKFFDIYIPDDMS